MPSDSSADRPRPAIKTIGELFDAARQQDRPTFTLTDGIEYDAFERLLAHCRRHYGKGFGDEEVLNRAIGQVACFHNMKQYQVNHLPLPDFLELFLKAIGWGKGKAGKQRRGAPMKKETIQRAEFAKPLIEKGLTWLEIFERYSRTNAGKADEAANPDSVSAGVSPPISSQVNRHKPMQTDTIGL